MDITYTDDSQKLFKYAKIATSQIEDTINAPDKTKTIHIDNFDIKFYTKRELSPENDYILIVQAHIIDTNVTVLNAYKIFSDVVVDADYSKMDPLELFSVFLDLFGVTVTVGIIKAKFIYHQIIEVDSGNQDNIASWELPDTDLVLKTMLLQYRPENGKHFVDCALVYCVNIDNYRKWLGEYK